MSLREYGFLRNSITLAWLSNIIYTVYNYERGLYNTGIFVLPLWYTCTVVLNRHLTVYKVGFNKNPFSLHSIVIENINFRKIWVSTGCKNHEISCVSVLTIIYSIVSIMSNMVSFVVSNSVYQHYLVVPCGVL